MFNFFGWINFTWTKVDQWIAVKNSVIKCIRELVYNPLLRNLTETQNYFLLHNYITPIHDGFS